MPGKRNSRKYFLRLLSEWQVTGFAGCYCSPTNRLGSARKVCMVSCEENRNRRS